MIKRIKNTYKNKDIKTLLDNFIALVLLRGVDIVIPLLVLPYVIKTVGVLNYGKFAYVFSVVFYFLYISQYGFSLSAVRDIAQERNNWKKINEIFNRVIFTKLFIFLMCILLLLVLMYSINSLHSEIFLVLTTFLIVFGDILNPSWLYQGMEKMKYMTIVNVVSKLTYVALVFIFIKKESDYILIGLLQAFGYILAGIISLVMAIKVFNLKFIRVKMNSVFSTLKSGASSFVTLVIPMLYVNTSTFLLGLYGYTAQVAYFDTAYKVSNGFVSLNQIITNVFYPYVTRKSDKFKTISFIIITLGCLMSLSCFILSEWIVNVLFGSVMHQSIIVLKILSLSPLFLAIRSAYGINYLLVKNKDRLYMNIALVSSIIAFAVGLFLIFYYKSIGAAIVVILAQGIYSLSSMYIAISLMKKND